MPTHFRFSYRRKSQSMSRTKYLLWANTRGLLSDVALTRRLISSVLFQMQNWYQRKAYFSSHCGPAVAPLGLRPPIDTGIARRLRSGGRFDSSRNHLEGPPPPSFLLGSLFLCLSMIQSAKRLARFKAAIPLHKRKSVFSFCGFSHLEIAR